MSSDRWNGSVDGCSVINEVSSFCSQNLSMPFCICCCCCCKCICIISCLSLGRQLVHRIDAGHWPTLCRQCRTELHWTSSLPFLFFLFLFFCLYWLACVFNLIYSSITLTNVCPVSQLVGAILCVFTMSAHSVSAALCVYLFADRVFGVPLLRSNMSQHADNQTALLFLCSFGPKCETLPRPQTNDQLSLWATVGLNNLHGFQLNWFCAIDKKQILLLLLFQHTNKESYCFQGGWKKEREGEANQSQLPGDDQRQKKLMINFVLKCSAAASTVNHLSE